LLTLVRVSAIDELGMTITTTIDRWLPRAVQQNVFYALGILVMKGVSFFMLPFIAHQLSTTAFGQLEILNSLGALASVLVGFGLLNSLFRFAGSETSDHTRRVVAAEMFGISLLIGTLAFAGALLAAGPIASLMPGGIDAHATRLALFIVALEGGIAIPLGWLRLQDRAGLYFLLSTGKALLQAALTWALLMQGRGIQGILEAGLVSAALLALVLVFLQWRSTGIRLNLRKIRQLLHYSLPLVGSGLLGFALTGLDRWILADAVGPAEMAQYALAAKFAVLAALFLQPFLMWWSPRRFSVLQETNGREKAARYAAMGSAMSLLIVVAVGLGAPLIIDLMFPQSYAEAKQYLPWLVLAMALKDSAELLNLGCYTGSDTRAQFKINLVGAAIGVAGFWLLVPVLGIWGAILSLLTAQALRLALYLYVSQRILHLPYPMRRLIGLAMLSLLLLWSGEQVHDELSQSFLAGAGILIMLMAAGRMRLLPFGFPRTAAA
jgi:O-antigen/teichoic acid export membrane protein